MSANIDTAVPGVLPIYQAQYNQLLTYGQELLPFIQDKPADIGVGAKVGFGQAILVCRAGSGAAELGPVPDDVAHQSLKLRKQSFTFAKEVYLTEKLSWPS